MVSRYFKIQNQLSALVELLQLLPTPVEVDVLSRGFKALKNFQAITLMLQRDGIPFVEVRSIFNLLIADFAEMEYHLGAESRLVVDRDFEMGLTKIAKGATLTADEQVACSSLLKKEARAVIHGAHRDDNSDEEDEEVNYAEKVKKRLKMEEMESIQRDQYVNVHVVPGTSVNCERLFSLATHILTDTRKNTCPLLFEALLFLRVNRDLWNSYSVGKAMGRTREREDLGIAGDDTEQDRGGSDDEYGNYVDLHLNDEVLFSTVGDS